MQNNYMQKLKELREDNDLLNIDMGKILHCTPQHYGRMESGKRLFSIQQIIMLSNFYKVSINYILGNESHKTLIDKEYTFTYEKLLKQMIALRVNNAYTQVYISKEVLNISQSMYSRFEKNIHKIDILSIIKLANLYKVSISQLLDLEE